MCAAIKGDRELAGIPVVMTTGAGKNEDHAVCRNAGCDELLTKPFERASYLATIRRFIPELERREPRHPCRAAVRFKAYHVNMSGTILDLSKNGLYIATEYALETGTEIALVFSLAEDGKTHIQAKAVVRWRNSGQGIGKACSPAGFGVEFTAFAGDSLANLNRYLAQLNP